MEYSNHIAKFKILSNIVDVTNQKINNNSIDFSSCYVFAQIVYHDNIENAADDMSLEPLKQATIDSFPLPSLVICYSLLERFHNHPIWMYYISSWFILHKTFPSELQYTHQHELLAEHYKIKLPKHDITMVLVTKFVGDILTLCDCIYYKVNRECIQKQHHEKIQLCEKGWTVEDIYDHMSSHYEGKGYFITRN